MAWTTQVWVCCWGERRVSQVNGKLSLILVVPSLSPTNSLHMGVSKGKME